MGANANKPWRRSMGADVSITESGISREKNPEIYNYLQLQLEQGHISAQVMELVIDSFYSLELPVVSKEHVEHVIKQKKEDDDALFEKLDFSLQRHLLLIASYAALNTIINYRGFEHIEPQLKKCHTDVLRFFA
jgi:hypothetical protein